MTTRQPASAAASGTAADEATDVAVEPLLQLIGALPQARMPLIEDEAELHTSVFLATGCSLLSEMLEWLHAHEYCKGRLTWSHYHGWTCTIVAPDLDTLHGGVLKRDVTAFGVSPEEAVGNAILYATREEPPR